MTYDEKVEAMCRAIWSEGAWTWDQMTEGSREPHRKDARRWLTAVGIEQPKPVWPSDEMLLAFRAAYRSCTNHDLALTDAHLRDCLKEVAAKDPVHQTAVELARGVDRRLDAIGERPGTRAEGELHRAVEDAGLL